MCMYRSFHFTSIGASHIKKGTVCQDYSASMETDYYKLAVISDGHGGADYFRSDRGSRFAVEVFCHCAAEAFVQPDIIIEETQSAEQESFLRNKAKNFADALHMCRTEKQIEERMRWFMRSVVTHWNLLVDEDIANEPFREEEMTEVSEKARNHYASGEKVQRAYGATLIGAVITEDFWFGIHIGDGKCVAFHKDGTECEPIPWDEDCFLNVTTSICDFDAGSKMRYYFSRELPAAVFVASDGIDDCFCNERGLHNFYRTILTSFAVESEETAVINLSEYLPVMSAKGSADDMSVGCIIDIEHIRKHAELYEKIKVPYMNILRVGNLGAKIFSEDYTQKKEIEAIEGIVHLDMIGCYGFGKGLKKLEVTSVTDHAVTFVAKGKEYLITPENIVEITEETVHNGAVEYDRLIIRCVMK